MTQNADADVEARFFDLLQRLDEGEQPEPALAAVCAGTPEMAATLRRRLSSLRDIGMLGGVEPEQMPERLGEFRLQGRLGGGGMGVVYLAEQEELGRQVAVKVIQPAQLYFEGARERFRREVETVARLQHPGIVPIYAVGEADGIPYFAMERVTGCTLHELLSKLKGRTPSELSGADMAAAIAAATPEAEVPVTPAYVFGGTWEEAALHLARQIADALHHAHRRGVLHRDVKPSNVMVTLDGRAMLLDFGLASGGARGAASLTRTGSALGSLPYMSPEQTRGENDVLDERTDVYALGVTLYELLALVPAFGDGSSPETASAIQLGRRVAPRQRNPGVSWEAETVCLTAMDPDPGRRYASAADFHRDLDNVLEHRPVEAQRAGVVLRVRRWTQRHPAAAVTLLLGGLLIVGGPGLYAWQEHKANLLVQQEQVLTNVQRLRAEASLQHALDAVDTMLTRVSDVALRHVPQMEPVRRDLLDEAIAFYRELLEQEGQDPRLLLQISRTLQLVGEMHWQMGDSERAQLVHEESVAVLRRLMVEHPDLSQAPRALAQGLRKVGQQAWEQGGVEEGLALTKEAIEVEEALLLLDEATWEDRAQLGMSLTNYGGMVYEHDLVEAERVLRRGAEVFGELSAEYPDETGHRYHRASSLASLAAILGARGDLDEGFGVYVEAIDALEALVEWNPDHTQARLQLAMCLMNYGTDLGPDQEPEARRHLSRSIDLYEQLALDYPSTPRYLRGHAQSLVNLALRHLDEGDYARAEALMVEGELIQVRLVPLMHYRPAVRLDLALTRINLACVALEQDRLVDAQGSARQSITALEDLLYEMDGHPLVLDQLSSALHNLGEALWKGGELEKAADALEQSVARARAALAGNPETVETTENLCEHLRLLSFIRRDAGDHAAAVSLAEELTTVGELSAERWWQAALCVTTCVPAARDGVARAYAERAVQMLERAIALGWSDTEDITTDETWAPLRDLEGFTELVAATSAQRGAP